MYVVCGLPVDRTYWFSPNSSNIGNRHANADINSSKLGYVLGGPGTSLINQEHGRFSMIISRCPLLVE
jgi:hypothetical protein